MLKISGKWFFTPPTFSPQKLLLVSVTTSAEIAKSLRNKKTVQKEVKKNVDMNDL